MAQLLEPFAAALDGVKSAQNADEQPVRVREFATVALRGMRMIQGEVEGFEERSEDRWVGVWSIGHKKFLPNGLRVKPECAMRDDKRIASGAETEKHSATDDLPAAPLKPSRGVSA